MGCKSIAGYPPAFCRRYPFILLGGEKHCESKVPCPHNTVTQTRARTRTARSGVQRANDLATRLQQDFKTWSLNSAYYWSSLTCSTVSAVQYKIFLRSKVFVTFRITLKCTQKQQGWLIFGKIEEDYERQNITRCAIRDIAPLRRLKNVRKRTLWRFSVADDAVTEMRKINIAKETPFSDHFRGLKLS